jgi:hypothetical protein
MNMRRLCLFTSCLLAANVLAQTNTATTVSGRDEIAGGINDDLVTPDSQPIATRITVGFASDHAGPESVKPGTARIVTTDGRELKAFALTDGDNKGAVVGYMDEFTLMVREQKGARLGKVFSPRLCEKFKRLSKTTADGGSVSTTTYDGRPLTDAEAYVFEILDWVPKE